MTRPLTPHAEPEVLAAQNRRAMTDEPPSGWLSAAEVDEVMIAAAIGWAAGWAERAFLDSFGKGPACVDQIVTFHAAELRAEGDRAARDLAGGSGATPEQRARLQAGRADVFDRRLTFLWAFAVRQWGCA